MKVGRNDPCPCGSGRKFKKCHLNMPPLEALIPPPRGPSPPPEILEHFERHEREEAARIRTFGDIRPVIHIPEYAGYRLVGVRNRIYRSKTWNFFSDFLFDYGTSIFGKEWLEKQKAASPAEWHPLYAWRKQAHEFQMRQQPVPDGTYAVTPNGAMLACNNFYYDLYCVDDNSILDEALLARLRHREQFQGALHELFAAATCLRAGFEIFFENERDVRRRHTEFVAIHKATKQHLLVEAKSRHRTGVMGRAGAMDSEPDIRFQKLINEAIKKDPHNPLAIFVDTNLPVERAERFYTPQSTSPPLPSKAMVALMTRVRKDNEGTDPYNFLAFSNHPQHYANDDSLAPGNHWATFISNKARVRVYKEQALKDLLRAMNIYGNVPTHFPPRRE